ncbi:cation diffusion facilitator family transporter [Bhargavaea beijingensis]|uniref:Cation diffusion facilitator family transporter n=1 Tax=Bhargavaea beijingensis TaxID=426756 RepID=A0A1G7G823_9BACL|nr:cation diffusion facilitator family transporter [Bhargavaea beijingensis]MCW1927427.1 cation diffusion facilitator family transporter [Bhargavaea beijingensis]RSK30068.1 cation transporter [Bhargavaea beijingensis]SDE84247.1 cation diffusion facilitator family transporter [Bhargavaea beijingensis]
MDLYSNLKQGERGAWVSIFSYIMLSTVKFIAGVAGSSEALKADALNNTTDVVASIAVLIGLRISQKPPDHNHRYGHLRAETIASLIASFIMAVVGLQVLADAIGSIFSEDAQTPSAFTGFVALASGLVMYGVYLYNLRLAEKIGSSALRAAALDNRSDALVSFGAAAGIAGAIFGFPVIDTITALIIALLILHAAGSIFKEAVYTLTDGFDEDEGEALAHLAASVPGVIRLKDFKGRMHGNMMFIDLTVTVDPSLNVIESHRITEQIERRLQKAKPFSTVLVHIEPDIPKKP